MGKKGSNLCYTSLVRKNNVRIIMHLIPEHEVDIPVVNLLHFTKWRGFGHDREDRHDDLRAVQREMESICLVWDPHWPWLRTHGPVSMVQRSLFLQNILCPSVSPILLLCCLQTAYPSNSTTYSRISQVWPLYTKSLQCIKFKGWILCSSLR